MLAYFLNHHRFAYCFSAFIMVYQLEVTFFKLWDAFSLIGVTTENGENRAVITFV